MKLRNWSRLLAGHGEMILDCCAAPGSKTALLARRNPRAKVFATELHPHRARLLQSLHRCRTSTSSPPTRGICLSREHSTAFSPMFLAPAPALWPATRKSSGGSKPKTCTIFSRGSVAILKSALAQLATGGRLVYSTCSLEREENEAVVETTLEEMTEFRIGDFRGELEHLRESGELSSEMDGKGITSLLAGPYLKTIPGVHPCDGFFAALILRR
jgi:16S rRNA (cytosine967-C5)-methyltransferase